jgi:hypothetical protein
MKEEELHDFYRSPSILTTVESRKLLRTRYIDKGECTHNFGGETPRKRKLQRPKMRWKCNIKIELRKMSCADE